MCLSKVSRRVCCVGPEQQGLVQTPVSHIAGPTVSMCCGSGLLRPAQQRYVHDTGRLLRAAAMGRRREGHLEWCRWCYSLQEGLPDHLARKSGLARWFE